MNLIERLQYHTQRICEWGKYFWGYTYSNEGIEVLFLDTNEKFQSNELYDFWKTNKKDLRFIINKKNQVALGNAYEIDHIDLSNILAKNGINGFMNPNLSDYNGCIPGFINSQFKIEFDFTPAVDRYTSNKAIYELKEFIKKVKIAKNRLGIDLDPQEKEKILKALKEIERFKKAGVFR